MITRLAFVKCIKLLNACYCKKTDQEQLESWYNYFSDISYTTLYKAVKEIIVESKCYPTAPQLKEKCRMVNKNYLLDIITKMKDDGYFKKGSYGELSDEQAYRNYDKALMWLEKGNLPEFLKNDMRSYINQNNQIEQRDRKLLNNAKDL